MSARLTATELLCLEELHDLWKEHEPHLLAKLEFLPDNSKTFVAIIHCYSQHRKPVTVALSYELYHALIDHYEKKKAKAQLKRMADEAVAKRVPQTSAVEFHGAYHVVRSELQLEGQDMYNANCTSCSWHTCGRMPWVTEAIERHSARHAVANSPGG